MIAAEGIPEGFRSAETGRAVLGGGEQWRHASGRPLSWTSLACVCIFRAVAMLEKISMTQQTHPRSPKALLGGIAHLGRFIDKIRLRTEGKIQDYNYITVGFDKYLIDFLQIDPKAFEQRVLAGGTDEELLGWVKANCRRPSDQEGKEKGSGVFS